MRIFTFQTVISISIAVLTTVITTAFTRYLLARPWCIQIESEKHQRIVYGSNNCSPGDVYHPHRRHTARENHFDENVYSEYQ